MSDVVRTAVIPAAGLGTRFLPATKAQPKEMLPVVDKPAIQYVVEEAVRAGIDDILIITGRGKRSIEDHFDRQFELEYFLEAKGKKELLNTVRDLAELADIHYVRQGEPLGLGHAVSVARKHVGNRPFAVMLGDDLMIDDSRVLRSMIDAHAESGAPVVALRDVPRDEISLYGCADVAGDGSSPVVQINGIVEKPDPHDGALHHGRDGPVRVHTGDLRPARSGQTGRGRGDPAHRCHRPDAGGWRRPRLCVP